jgi:uncharacterized protein YigE (DUF2233 family)
MRTLFAAVALLVATCLTVAAAPWTVTSREQLESAPGTEFQRIRVQGASATAEVLLFSAPAATYTVSVLDDPQGDLRVATAARGTAAVAVVNGGYFHPDRTPLGLLIADGQTLHGQEKARLLSGLMVADGTRVSLLRPAEYKASPKHRTALQAGPFLVDKGTPVGGLNTVKSAARTVVLVADGGKQFGVAVCRYGTLAESAEIFTTKGLWPGHTISRVLNLDGGTSTGLWVSQTTGAFHVREWKNVRNYVAIVPR